MFAFGVDDFLPFVKQFTGASINALQKTSVTAKNLPQATFFCLRRRCFESLSINLSKQKSNPNSNVGSNGVTIGGERGIRTLATV